MLRLHKPFSPSKITRRQSEDTVWGYVDLMKQLKAEYPDFVAGFDLVGQEDLGYPLNNFLEPLLSLSSGNTSIPVFYHAGETGVEDSSL